MKKNKLRIFRGMGVKAKFDRLNNAPLVTMLIQNHDMHPESPRFSPISLPLPAPRIAPSRPGT